LGAPPWKWLLPHDTEFKSITGFLGANMLNIVKLRSFAYQTLGQQCVSLINEKTKQDLHTSVSPTDGAVYHMFKSLYESGKSQV
jgi:hypothetical protein